MMKKSKLLVCSLFMCMAFSILPGMKSSAEEKQGETPSSASEIQDENTQRLEETTIMDQNANIYEVDDEDGSVENGKNGIALFSRSASGAKVVNFNTKGNSVTYYTDGATGAQGYTNGAYGADAAYLGMSGTKVRFMLSGVIGTVDVNDVELVDYSAYKNAVSYYTASNGKLIHYISQNLKTAQYSQLSNGPAPSWMEEGVRYYSYDGHYFYTDYEAMTADYGSGTRDNSVNKSTPFYNYYQFLPLRSRTAYSADEINAMILGKTQSSSKLRSTGTAFVSYQNTYGVNALLALSVAANESGWGTSSICQQKNNLFGLNATDSAPGEDAYTFSSVDECIRQFMSTHMSSAYLYPKNWSYNGGFLGNKGGGINVSYASDPYWGERAAAIAWTLDSTGGTKDARRYTIGAAEGNSNINIRSEASTGSSVLYTTGSRQVYPVLVLNQETTGGFYKIQSDGVINSSRSALEKKAEYDFDKMYAYISADYIDIVSAGDGSTGDAAGENDGNSGSTGDVTGGNDGNSGSTGDVTGGNNGNSGSTGDVTGGNNGNSGSTGDVTDGNNGSSGSTGDATGGNNGNSGSTGDVTGGNNGNSSSTGDVTGGDNGSSGSTGDTTGGSSGNSDSGQGGITGAPGAAGSDSINGGSAGSGNNALTQGSGNTESGSAVPGSSVTSGSGAQGSESSVQETETGSESTQGGAQTLQSGQDNKTSGGLEVKEKDSGSDKTLSTVSTSSEKETAAVSSRAPQTGDSSNYTVWAAAAGISLLLAVSTLIRKRYNRG